MRVEEIAGLFFDWSYCENGCPIEIISDWDKIFMSKFWWSVMRLSEIKHKMSMAYYSQMDSLSEWSNKTIIQCIHFHINWQQKGWSKVLQNICFDIMNSVNASTGHAPFMLKSGHQPCLIPPIIHGERDALEEINLDLSPGKTNVLTSPPPSIDSLYGIPNLQYTPAALSFMEDLQSCLADAMDSLFAAKISQALKANTLHGPDLEFKVGNKVLLSTEHWRHEYTQKKEGWVAKFMPHFNGPYMIEKAFSESSMYTLHLPASSLAFSLFHVSLLKKYNKNNANLFPNHKLPKPGPIITVDGQDKYFIEKILDKQRHGHGHQYLVHWLGYGPEGDLWLPCSELLEMEALELWDKRNDGR